MTKHIETIRGIGQENSCVEVLYMNPNLQQVSSVYFVMFITLGLVILLIRYTVTLCRYLKDLL
ncbi:MAG: hypothetical protein ACLRPW_10090 [Intestinibacter sp.]